MERLAALLITVALTVVIGAPGTSGATACAQDQDDQQQPAHQTYSNPIIDNVDAADPAVIRYENKYYLYPTYGRGGYHVFVSDDLVNWTRHPTLCYADPRGGAWAPDVFHHVRGDGKFYLYYTVNQRGSGKAIGVAVADHPLGPFVDQGTLVRGVIDAHMFQDADDRLYLYYVDLNGFTIVLQPMLDPVTKDDESPPTVVIRPSDPWEMTRGRVTEGPWMLTHQGVYYLMYSGSSADGPDYAIGYATAASPTGPFTKHPGNPIAKRGNGVFGPGHHAVTTGPDGKLWMVYHQKTGTEFGWSRFLAIDPLWFDDNGVIHVKTTRGTDEPAPTDPPSDPPPSPPANDEADG